MTIVINKIKPVARLINLNAMRKKIYIKDKISANLSLNLNLLIWQTNYLAINLNFSTKLFVILDNKNKRTVNN